MISWLLYALKDASILWLVLIILSVMGKFIQLLVKYLCIPATCVPSEKVLCCSWNSINSKQACIHPESINMYCFYKNTFNFVYSYIQTLLQNFTVFQLISIHVPKVYCNIYQSIGIRTGEGQGDHGPHRILKVCFGPPLLQYTGY